MRRLPALLLGVALLAGCSSSNASPTPGNGKGKAADRTLTVYAAASLTKAFTGMAKAFEQAQPGVKVELSFAGSQTLVAQITQGAPADVLATADVATATSVQDELSGTPAVFAHNALALVTPLPNPANVTTLADLGRPGVKVVLANPTVPVGKAAKKALDQAGVTVTPVSLEDAVTGVVTKVRLGEADAGIAYVTDLVGTQGISGTPLPGTSTDLAIAAVKASKVPDDAAAFVAFVRGAEGRRILESWGFT